MAGFTYLDFAQLADRSLGREQPDRAIPAQPPCEGRDHAIGALFDYLAQVPYHIADLDGGGTRQGLISRANMFPEMPDAAVELKFPTLGIIPGKGELETFLGPAQVEETDPHTGRGFIYTGEYNELLTLEIWASKLPMRRAIVSAIRNAFNVSERRYGLILKLARYHDIECRWRFRSVMRIEDGEDAALNRRRAQIELELSVPEVREINTSVLEIVQLTTIATASELDEVGLDVAIV